MKLTGNIKTLSVAWLSFIIFLAPILGMLFTPTVASAQNDLFPCSGGAGNNTVPGATSGASTQAGDRACTFGDLVEVADTVANKIVQIGLLLSPFIFAYAGWLYLTSGANPGQRKRANHILINVIIGLVVMLGAWLAVNLVLTSLVCVGSIKGFPWPQPPGGQPGCPSTSITPPTTP